jgi:1,2-phenylacetyl-CoA epoxidase PaaB subunit
MREGEREKRRTDWANRDPKTKGAYNTKRKKRREKRMPEQVEAPPRLLLEYRP